jgi:hypothetical protein
MKVRFLVALLPLFLTSGAGAEVYRTADGLSSDWVTSILVEQDSVWVGTVNGISIFDKGSGRWTIKRKEDTGGAIPDNRISALASTKSYIWIATVGGVARMEKGSGEWRKFTRGNSGIPSELVRGLAPDGEDLWIGTAGSGVGLYIAAEDRWIRYTWANTGGALATDYISYVLVDGDLIWFGTVHEGGEGLGGATLYDKRSGRWRRFDPPPPKGPSDDDTTCIVSAKGLLFFGSYGNGGSTCGLSVYDPSKGSWDSYSIIERTSGRSGSLLNGERVNALAFDGRRLWIGMGDLREDGGPDNGAIAIYDMVGGGWHAVKPSSLGLSDERVTAIAIDGDSVWIGTYGGGIGRFARPLDEPRPLELSSVKVDPDPAGPGRVSISLSLPEKPWTISKIVVIQEGSDPVTITPYALGGMKWGADYEVIKGKDGKARVQVWAKDEFGGDLLGSFEFTVDTTSPPPPVLDPLPKEVSSFSILVSGTAEPGSVVEVTDNGKSVGGAMAGEDGRFEVSIRLSYGRNAITARAKDRAGNWSGGSDPVEVELVFPEPVLDELPPLTNEKWLTVKGISAPGANVEVYVNGYGYHAYLSSDGRFSADIELREGENIIKAVCRWEEGWERESELRYITLDTNPPWIEVREPVNGSKFLYPTCVVSGEVEPDSSLFLDGKPVPNISGRFLLFVDLRPGENRISLMAVDRAGNTTTVERDVLFDPWMDPKTGGLISIPDRSTGFPAVEILIPPEALPLRARAEVSSGVGMGGAITVAIRFIGEGGMSISLRFPMEIRFRKPPEPSFFPAFWDGVRWRRMAYKADGSFLVVRTLSPGRYGLVRDWVGGVGRISLFPNPFSPNGDGVNDIVFVLCEDGVKRVLIRDLRGEILFSADGFGAFQLQWDGRDRRGRVVGSGIYICEVETERGFIASLLIVGR